MKLGDLFASFADSWPDDKINTSWPPSTDGSGLAAQAAGLVEVEDVVTAVGPDGTVTVTGRLTLIPGANVTSPPRLTSHLFPSLWFSFIPAQDWTSDFRASVAPSGTATVQIDTLPLKVFVPPDLLGAHPTPTAAGHDFGIELSEGAGDTTITRDFSFLMDAERQIRLEPHLPISIGRCTLFGVPVRAVHELNLIASPRNAGAQADWVVRSLAEDVIPFSGGALAFGGIELDWDEPGSVLQDLRKRLRLRHDAHVILEDIILPSVLFPPVPLHGTLGVRRNLDVGEDLSEHLTFADAPVVIPLGRDVEIFLSKFFYKTRPDDPLYDEHLLSGLTLEAGVSWPDSSGDDWEAEVGLIDGDVLRLSVARKPPTPDPDIPLVRLDVWKYVIDFFRLRVGLSTKELLEFDSEPGEAFQVLVDILIQEDPSGSGSASAPAKLETEDGSPVKAALMDIGWDRGKPSGTKKTPRGVQAKLARFVLEVHEMGLAYEQGATYFTVSGSIRENTAPLQGGVWFTRLRAKLAGNPAAPDFQLGGVGLDLKKEGVVEITAHGSYRDERLPDGTRIEEQGFGGGLVIYAGGKKWGLSTDVFWGTTTPPPTTPPSGDPSDFFLMLLSMFGTGTMGPVELQGIEALYATGLMPKIEDGDRETGELKYYKWLKRARPTALPESRGLSAWTPTPDAWAFGLGLSVSIIGCGSAVKLRAFGAGFDSPAAAGLVVVVELKMFGAKKPIAVGVIEYDFRSDDYVLMFPVDVKLADCFENFPPQLDVKFSGTVTIANPPFLLALGRLGDPETWPAAKVELEVSRVFEVKTRVAVCFEYLDDTHWGGGLSLSVKVTGGAGVIRLQGWGTLEVLVLFMRTGTNDFAALLRFELGFAVILFRFLRFGISLELLAEWLAHVPNYFVFRVTFRFETPWFLPDVSYTVECVEGELEPSKRAVATGPLMQAGAIAPGGTFAARVQRVDSGEGGEPTALASVDQLDGVTGAWKGKTQPVPLDATVEIGFSVMLVDKLGIGAVNADFGEQVSGDSDASLTTRYTLVGLTMRRRPLSGGPWETVEALTGAASARNFRWSWDDDTRFQGQVAPKKLLLNGRTPFSVGLDNPVGDAEILEDNPAYPCCLVRRPDVARFDFEDEGLGTLPAGFVRQFRYEDRGIPAPVRIQGLACVVTPPHVSGATASLIGAFAPAAAPVATVTATEDLAVALVRVAVDGRRKARLVVVAFDAGTEVARHHDNTGASPFVDVKIEPGRVFRTIVVRVEDLERGQHDSSAPATIVLDSVECVTQRDRERFDRDRDRCGRESSVGTAQPVTFLARHEYEVAITTEVAVRHSATEWETATLTERVGFVTAGPPGLNESPVPGLELEPYVVSLPPGGRGLTYREEPVHVVLSDSLSIFGPGSGTTEADHRLPVTVVIDSAFDANPAAHAGKGSRASAEWFVANRGAADPWLTVAELGLVRALSRSGTALRYQALSEASVGTCPPDDVWVEEQPSVAVDPFEPSGPGLWEPMASYVAIMRLAQSPVVDRDPFEAEDISSFMAVSGTWSFDDGALVATTAATGAFGDADWDLYRVDVHGALAPGGELGVVVLADPANPSQGVRALIRRDPAGGGTLIVESATGVPIQDEAVSDIGEASGLAVEVFADTIRCRCGDAKVRVPRDTRGAGGCLLLAADARVTSLQVRGIDMYRRPFHTSRYEGFGEHVGSCAGLERYDAGPAAEPLTAVRARLGGALAAAMEPAAPAADREARFGDTASALAVPLREDAQRLHLTCVSSPTDRWFLLETPEPMDFTEEIVLGLALKVVRPGLSDAERARLGALIEAALRKPQPHEPGPFGTGPIREDRRGVRGLIVPEAFPGTLVAPGSRRPAYSAILEGKFLVVTERATGTVGRVRAPAFSLEDRALLEDVRLDLNASLQIIHWHLPSLVSWIDQDVTVIQNGPGTHALVLPAVDDLADGTYQLTLSLTRRWFKTTDPVGPGNAYLHASAIEFELAG